jgi:hypothetical protein
LSLQHTLEMAKSQHALRYRAVTAMLRQMREEAGLTQRGLAARMNRPQPWVHKSEVGERRTDVSEFLDWCLGCGIDPEEGFRRLVRGRR